MLAEAVGHLGNVRIETLKGLVVDFAREHGAEPIVKGLRAVSDFEYELQMAQMNQRLSGIDTVLHLHQPASTRSSRRASCARSRSSAATCPRMVPPGGRRPRLGGTVLEVARLPMSDEQAYDLETLLLQLREIIDTARTMPMSASVLVNREETLEIVDDALRSLPEELRHAALAAQGARGVPRAGAPRRRGHRRGGARAGRADGRAHRGRPGGAARRAAGRRRTPRPTAGACATRPRTTSTRSWRRSRWCSSARCRRCSEDASSSRRSSSRCRPTRPSRRCPTSTNPGFSTRTTCNRRYRPSEPPNSSGCYPRTSGSRASGRRS